MKGLRELLRLGENRYEDLTPQVQVGLALMAKRRPGETYAGTVTHAEVQRRRAKNRCARASRRINRGRR